MADAGPSLPAPGLEVSRVAASPGWLDGRADASRRAAPRLLATWTPEPGPASEDAVAEAVALARERTGGGPVDLLQFHPLRYADPGWLDRLFMLAEHRDAGRIRRLGLANCDAVHLDMAVRSGVPIATNLVRCSLLDRRAGGAMTDVCRAHGVRLLAYGTLAGGFLSDRWLGRPEPPPDESLAGARTECLGLIGQAGGWDRFQALLQAADRVARSREVSISSVARRCVLELPAVAGIVVGARRGESGRMDDDLEAPRFPLDAGARRDLDAAVGALDPIGGDCGDEFRPPPPQAAPDDPGHDAGAFPAPYPVRRSHAAARVFTGTPWEETAGYCRAVRSGRRIRVAGTTAAHGDRLIGGRDPAAQTHFIIDKIEGALLSLGASLQHVVRTRVYIRNGVDWEPVARAHGARFAAVRPANTTVFADTIGEDLLVEVEADAEVR